MNLAEQMNDVANRCPGALVAIGTSGSSGWVAIGCPKQISLKALTEMNRKSLEKSVKRNEERAKWSGNKLAKILEYVGECRTDEEIEKKLIVYYKDLCKRNGRTYTNEGCKRFVKATMPKKIKHRHDMDLEVVERRRKMLNPEYPFEFEKREVVETYVSPAMQNGKKTVCLIIEGKELGSYWFYEEQGKEMDEVLGRK